MEKLINDLFAARDLAHKLHLSTKSFAKHMALGDLYDALLETADDLAEVYQGQYGLLNLGGPSQAFQVPDTQTFDALAFIRVLSTWAEAMKAQFNPADTHLLNMWDELLSKIYRAKYKLENLA
jgi:hypothetical protein